MKFIDILLMIIYPAILTILQIFYPKKTIRPLYFISGFVLFSIFGVGLYLYLSKSSNFANYLIILSVIAPIMFAVLKFGLFPLFQYFIKLKELPKILGAIDWGIKRSHNIDTYNALESIKTSFDFMGFGFSKYLKAKQDNSIIINDSVDLFIRLNIMP